LLYCAVVAAEDADAILGYWQTQDEEGHADAIVEIIHAEHGYEGYVRWLRFTVYPEGDRMAGQSIIDRDNPDVSLNTRLVDGMRVLWGLRYENKSWRGGHIYSVRSGKTYKANASLKSADELTIRGYIGVPMLGRSVHWMRVAELPSD